MIFINPMRVNIPVKWRIQAQRLTKELEAEDPNSRQDIIKSKRSLTWGDQSLVEAFKAVVGEKCWYTEIHIVGSDPNIDHFFPKSRVKVIDVNDDFNYTGSEEGYWWWAYEPLNYRLSCQHANQRRVFVETDGGKSDYFPVVNRLTTNPIDYEMNEEQFYALDPCSADDVRYLWFDNDGQPIPSNDADSEFKRKRVEVSIWLYHLDSLQLVKKRAAYIHETLLLVREADLKYADHISAPDNDFLTRRFNISLNKIRLLLHEKAEMVSAKRCFLRSLVADYEWIETEILQKPI